MYGLERETIDHILSYLFGKKSSCGHKKKHKSIGGAKKAQRLYMYNSKEIYHCAWCNFYHIGTSVLEEEKKKIVFEFFNKRIG